MGGCEGVGGLAAVVSLTERRGEGGRRDQSSVEVTDSENTLERGRTVFEYMFPYDRILLSASGRGKIQGEKNINWTNLLKRSHQDSH